MTPKEKAIELIYKFKFNPNLINEFGNQSLFDEEAKQCALIAVDEVIRYAKRWGDMADDDIREFEQVKEEINKI